MGKIIDITGRTFSRLTVICQKGKLANKPAWLCRCKCGKEVVVRGSDLRGGKHRSCGCLQIDSVTTHGMTDGHGKRKRGRFTGYSNWTSMIQRCHNPNSTGYARYGGRGIVVCERWRNSFVAFIADVGKRPSTEHSLDRINNDGNYEPGNVHWATREIQQNNRRVNNQQEYNGETKSITQWCRILGVNISRVRGRLRLGWSFTRAVETPSHFSVPKKN